MIADPEMAAELFARGRRRGCDDDAVTVRTAAGSGDGVEFAVGEHSRGSGFDCASHSFSILNSDLSERTHSVAGPAQHFRVLTIMS
jgi:hypothetical protein